MTSITTGNEQRHPAQLLELTCQIVAAYLANQPVMLADLPVVIQTVHQALRGVGQATTPEAKPAPAPAVSVRRSVTPEYLVCLEDGMRMTMLKRHLRTAHGLTPEEYRAKWGLAWDYPMTAPHYAEQRSAFARKIGLGRMKSVPEGSKPRNGPAASGSSRGSRRRRG
jgi:predicted transcriptional regulator